MIFVMLFSHVLSPSSLTKNILSYSLQSTLDSSGEEGFNPPPTPLLNFPIGLRALSRVNTIIIPHSSKFYF